MCRKSIAVAVLLSLICSADVPASSNPNHDSTGSLLVSDLAGMRLNYSAWSGKRPLGDINRQNIGNKTTSQSLIFSESVSYALFSHALRLEGEDEATAKKKFQTYWSWAKKNMVRKNVKQVYHWDSVKKWIPMPAELRDDLMAWRWVQTIEGTKRSGIIYQTDPAHNPQDTKAFQDGSQVATDGDLLTAYALVLAYERGWGGNYLKDAQAIMADLRKKTLADFKAGCMVDALAQNKPHNMVHRCFENSKVASIVLVDEPGAIAWKGKDNYVVFWHEPLLDLTRESGGQNVLNLKSIKLTLKGAIDENANVRFLLGDVIEGKKIGHVYASAPIPVAADYATVEIAPQQLAKYPHYGEQEGELDWARIKNLQIQVEKNDQLGYFPYHGAYADISGKGAIKVLTANPNVFAWSGNRCYYGFSYAEALDLSGLADIEIKMRGSGSVDFHLINEPPQGKEQGVAYCTRPVALSSKSKSYFFAKDDFSPFRYSPEGSFDWTKIKNLQFQISASTNTRVEVAYVKVRLNSGKTYWIKPLGDSTIALRSIVLELEDGQTTAHDGLHLASNAHGVPAINVSYFMPFAYRAFMKYDPQGAQVWQALLDNTYKVLHDSLNVTLHDLDGNPVKANGSLFPNWFQLDKLSGRVTDVSFQEKDSNVRGYLYGYDAFRTLWFLAYDYCLTGDTRDLELLHKAHEFFAAEMKSRGFICPVYRIDGTPDKCQTEADETSFGFYAVYLNLFYLMRDFANADRILQWYPDHRRCSDGRVWVKCSETGMNGGETEYFMNFWTLFGGYLFGQLDFVQRD